MLRLGDWKFIVIDKFKSHEFDVMLLSDTLRLLVNECFAQWYESVSEDEYPGHGLLKTKKTISVILFNRSRGCLPANHNKK